MTIPIVIVGCGGSGREVHDIIDAINKKTPTWQLIGYLDDNPSLVNLSLIKRRGTTLLGSTKWIATCDKGVQFAIGIANGAIREDLDCELTKYGLSAPILIHPTVTIGFDVRIGPGAIIWAGVRLTTNISVGRHVHLNQNTTIGHDSEIADYVTVNPMAAISGNVQIRRKTLIGTNSTILQGLDVGENGLVGAGACIVRDVRANAVVKGIPAR